ncbi:uncharacterized protein LOC133551330 isoform X2 [Nerophis ophidion]|uniref:uncharacterized protein LOC133551330 isoform X2 n=1 Tax=Nerophis ophidion TaxID=159077 RepID=UPI002ADF11F0|nr:uncharacterized protein LOC133551330 isoform X2 [Nerophis ophidion]
MFPFITENQSRELRIVYKLYLDSMSEADKDVDWSKGAFLSDSCHLLVEKSPPDYVRKISTFLDGSAGLFSQNPMCDDGPPGPESDSGDSLFLTQLSQPVRTTRRRRSTAHNFPFELEDSEGSASSFYVRRGKKRKITVPKYSFPFLTERRGKAKSTRLTTKKNNKLHNYVIGGFFKCLDVWQTAHNFQAALPTIDQDGENISPLTEDEGEENSGDEDFKERKCFLAKSKAKNLHTWYSPPPCIMNEKGAASQQREKNVQMSTLTKEKTNVGSTSTRNIKLISNDVVQTQTSKCPTQKTKSIFLATLVGHEPVNQEKSQVDTYCDELSLEGQDAVNEINDHLNNTDNVDETDQEKGTDFVFIQEKIGCVATSAHDNLLLNGYKEMENISHNANTIRSEDNCRGESDIAPLKQKKKKRKNRQEDENANLEHNLSVKLDCVFSVPRQSSCEKKKNKRVEESDNVEEFSSCATRDESPRKKRNKKKSHEISTEPLKEPECHLHLMAASQETIKRKKKKKYHKTQEDDDISEKPINEVEPLTGRTRKRKKVSSCVSEEASIYNPQNVADKTQKTTDDKDSELKRKRSCGNIQENQTSSFLVADCVEADSHDRKKKKKKKKSADPQNTVDVGRASCQSDSSETAKVGSDIKVTPENAVCLEPLQLDQAEVKTKKKKKKKKKHKDLRHGEPKENQTESESSTIKSCKKVTTRNEKHDTDSLTSMWELEEQMFRDLKRTKKKRKKQHIMQEAREEQLTSDEADKCNKNKNSMIRKTDSLIQSPHKKVSRKSKKSSFKDSITHEIAQI